jgi:hypothetical protein
LKPRKPDILFLRRVRGLNGGVLKTLDYFNHAKSVPGLSARLMILPLGTWNAALDDYLDSRDVSNDVGDPDIVLLSREWDEFDALGLCRQDCCVINLIQHTNYGIPGSPEYESLARPALRISLSSEFTQLLKTFPHLSGPLVTSPAAVDIRVPERPYQDRNWDVVVAGAKNPDVARSVADRISKTVASVKCLTERMPRSDYLSQVSSAKVLVALPYPSGEFAFLTALEGMHLGAAVVMPRTFGTSGYCIDQTSCVLTSYDPTSLSDACIDLLARPQYLDQLRLEGRRIARLLSLQAERHRFHDIIAHAIKTRLDLNEMANGVG